MSEQPDPTEPTIRVPITDPRWRDAVATVAHPIIAIKPDGRFRAVDTAALDLGDDHTKWLAFIDEALGGSAETVLKHHPSRHSYYLNSEAYHRGAIAEFNPVATLMYAHDHGWQLQQSKPLFGPVVLTGFDVRTHLPCPLDPEQTMAFLDAMQQNETRSRMEIEHLAASDDSRS